MTIFESCICGDSCDYEPCEFWEPRIVRARKEHECCECHETIHRGEEYEYLAYKFDGDFGIAKTCLSCLLVRQSICYCCGVGELWGEIHANYCGKDDESDECICPDEVQKRRKERERVVAERLAPKLVEPNRC